MDENDQLQQIHSIPGTVVSLDQNHPTVPDYYFKAFACVCVHL